MIGQSAKGAGVVGLRRTALVGASASRWLSRGLLRGLFAGEDGDDEEKTENDIQPARVGRGQESSEIGQAPIGLDNPTRPAHVSWHSRIHCVTAGIAVIRFGPVSVDPLVSSHPLSSPLVTFLYNFAHIPLVPRSHCHRTNRQRTKPGDRPPHPLPYSTLSPLTISTSSTATMVASLEKDASGLEAAGQIETKHLDVAPSKLSSEQDQDHDHGFTKEEQRKIIGRIDRRLVITVGAMYCVSLMDRTNMSAANIAGMGVELVLIDFRYVRSSGLFRTHSY